LIKSSLATSRVIPLMMEMVSETLGFYPQLIGLLPEKILSSSVTVKASSLTYANCCSKPYCLKELDFIPVV
jgi:hypothetical protein